MYGDMASQKDTQGRNSVIDLRSDTVTRPVTAMRAAMAEAAALGQSPLPEGKSTSR